MRKKKDRISPVQLSIVPKRLKMSLSCRLILAWFYDLSRAKLASISSLMSKPVTIWTNPSPTSSFGTQDVDVPLSDYDFFMISVARSTADQREVGCPIFSVVAPQNKYLTIAVAEVCYRTMSLNSGRTKITISDCVRCELNGSQAYDSTFLIPLKIFGIK